MTLAILSWASILCYLICLGCYGMDLIRRKPVLGKAATALLVLGLGVHFLALEHRASLTGSVPYNDLYGSMSLFAWMVALVYLVLELRHKQKAMSLFLVPIVILLQVIATQIQKNPTASGPGVKGWLFAFHVNVTMFAYSAYVVSFIASTMYLIQHVRLRARRSGRWFSLLPSLDLLERVNLTSVTIGVVALFIGILSGAVWARTAWHDKPQLWDAKITWSLLTVLVYSVYIFVQKRKGWRGPRSALIAVGGFLVVIFSYTVVNLFFSRLHTFF